VGRTSHLIHSILNRIDLTAIVGLMLNFDRDRADKFSSQGCAQESDGGYQRERSALR